MLDQCIGPLAQRRPAQPASADGFHLGRVGPREARTVRGRVGGDKAGDLPLHRQLKNGVDRALVHRDVGGGRELDQKGHLRVLARALRGDGVQQRREGLRRLKGLALRCVRAGYVQDDEVGVGEERLEARHEVLDAGVPEDIRAVGLREVDREGEACGAPGALQSGSDRRGPVVVEPHAVDQRRVLGEPKRAGLRVPGAGLRAHRAHLAKAEAKVWPEAYELSVLVQTGRDAHGRGKGQTQRVDAQPLFVAG